MIKVTKLAEKLRLWCCKMVEETRVMGENPVFTMLLDFWRA